MTKYRVTLRKTVRIEVEAPNENAALNVAGSALARADDDDDVDYSWDHDRPLVEVVAGTPHSTDPVGVAN